MWSKNVAKRPGPYKIILQNPNLLQVLVPVGRYFQQSHSSLSDAEREIVVNLINAKWHAVYSNYEHDDDRGKSQQACRLRKCKH